MKKFWNWKNKTITNQETMTQSQERILFLNGTIAEESWFDDEVTPALFKEELNTDYSNSVDSYEDIKFFKEDGTQSSHKLSSDVEAFLYNEGYIQYDKKTDELTYSLGEASKNYTKEQAIDTIFNAKLPVDVEEIVSYWATATNLFDFLTNQAMEEHFANTDREYKNILVNGDGSILYREKIKEKLKEKAFEEFVHEMSESEKKEVDELVSFTYNNSESR